MYLLVALARTPGARLARTWLAFVGFAGNAVGWPFADCRTLGRAWVTVGNSGIPVNGDLDWC